MFRFIQRSSKAKRFSFTTAIFAAVALSSVSALVQAQAYPNKPIKVVVSFPPGGAADQIARAVSVPLWACATEFACQPNGPCH